MVFGSPRYFPKYYVQFLNYGKSSLKSVIKLHGSNIRIIFKVDFGFSMALYSKVTMLHGRNMSLYELYEACCMLVPQIRVFKSCKSIMKKDTRLLGVAFIKE